MPYDLRIEDGKYGSYKMERLLMLDMGQQWVNGSVTVEEFERFLEDIFGFFDVRARRSCSQDKARQNFEKLYVEKVKHRKLDLEQLPVVSKLRELMNQTSAMDSYERVFEAYFDLAADVKNELPDHECIGHGDPCFSNILYDKRIRLLRLIDPRGAADRDALWGDPHYDFAKLSHSVLGGYDYIVNGLYQLNLNADLRLQLTTSEKSWLAYAAAFTRHLEGRFIDVRRIRILEASLFLSLLPLHQDVPRNLAAFLLIAAHILREVERQ
jgi:thiamine kinase-like enzyme